MAMDNPPLGPVRRGTEVDDALLEHHMRSLSQIRDPRLRFLAQELMAQMVEIRRSKASERKPLTGDRPV